MNNLRTDINLVYPLQNEFILLKSDRPNGFAIDLLPSLLVPPKTNPLGDVCVVENTEPFVIPQKELIEHNDTFIFRHENSKSNIMRINIVGNHKKDTGVSQDVHILHGILVNAFGKEIQIRHIPHFYPQCPIAEVNFFLTSNYNA